ncbi:MAG TPA: hypothetical protein VM367_12090 [Pseudonocardia sp.]|jgi:hypothetical protein|nr:hypothetical protein [Pseudonocardia sp.]
MPSWTRCRRSLLLGLVVVGLLAGLVGMHHVTAAGPPGVGHVATVPAPAEEHSTLLHLCVAVLAAGALLVLGLLAVRTGTAHGSAAADARPCLRASTRAPPAPVPRRLAQLCVLRT